MARRKQGKPRSGAGVTPNGGTTIGHEAELQARQAEAAGLDAASAWNLKMLGLGGDE